VAETTVEIPTRVLALGMAHEDGTIDAAELYPVADACGQSGEQVRSCLRRLVGEGLFVRKGTGGGARFEATARGMAALGATVERTRLAYAQDAAGRGCARQWRLVAFAVPDSRRTARGALRDPLLPPELLTRPWPGRTARDLLVKSRRYALAVREAHGRPALFRMYDDTVEAL